MEDKGTPTDLTRWNRKQRRDFARKVHLTIPGRNLPYVKNTHGTVKEYYTKREEELSQEKNNG
jgi:hypothetical protein